MCEYYIDCPTLHLHNVKTSEEIAKYSGDYIQAIIPIGKKKPVEYLIFQKGLLVGRQTKPLNDFIKNFKNTLDN